MDKKLENYLKDLKMQFKLHEHPAIFTVEEGKKLKQNIPGVHCKCLFLKDDSGNFYLVGMRADKRLDITRLRKRIEAKKLHFASEEELWDLLGLRPGSVSIFGMINDTAKNVKLIIDKEVWESPIVGFHPNINTATLEVKHIDLEKFYESIKSEKEIVEL